MAGVCWREAAPADLTGALVGVEDEEHGVDIVGEEEDEHQENDTSETTLEKGHAHTNSRVRIMCEK